MKRQRRKWTAADYRERVVRQCLTLHECELCGKHIVCGELYHDAGATRRAHVKCAKLQMEIEDV
jgi:hypothetical protein